MTGQYAKLIRKVSELRVSEIGMGNNKLPIWKEHFGASANLASCPLLLATWIFIADIMPVQGEIRKSTVRARIHAPIGMDAADRED